MVPQAPQEGLMGAGGGRQEGLSRANYIFGVQGHGNALGHGMNGNRLRHPVLSNEFIGALFHRSRNP